MTLLDMMENAGLWLMLMLRGHFSAGVTPAATSLAASMKFLVLPLAFASAAAM